MVFRDDEKVEDFIFDDAKIENQKILKTAADICSICQVGELNPDKDPTKVIIYGRNGPKIYYHQHMRCNFRNKYKDCRAGHSYGFSTHQGMRIYNDFALKNDILLVSRQSGFTVDF